jgi:hypothetical protein
MDQIMALRGSHPILWTCEMLPSIVRQNSQAWLRSLRWELTPGVGMAQGHPERLV